VIALLLLQAVVDRMTVHLPARAAAPAPAVIVCPGGGYGSLKREHEGRSPAERLARDGVAAFVLSYRLEPHPAPLEDVQEALRTVRARAVEWNIDPGRVGVLGFSAGGHLAACAATMGEERPDFAGLVYPVISFGRPHSHRGSERNLLGAGADDPARLAELSPDRRVSARTPPVFLVHSSEDSLGVENTLDFYRACRASRVSAELHVYGHGRHGFGIGLRDPAGVGLDRDDPVLATWPDRFVAWVRAREGVNKLIRSER
jgi:acetyl esterase/lipase